MTKPHLAAPVRRAFAHQLGTFFWSPDFPISPEGAGPKEATQMTRVLSLSTAVCLLGAALLSAPASATDFSEGADFDLPPPEIWGSPGRWAPKPGNSPPR